MSANILPYFSTPGLIILTHFPVTALSNFPFALKASSFSNEDDPRISGVSIPFILHKLLTL